MYTPVHHGLLYIKVGCKEASLQDNNFQDEEQHFFF